MFPVNTKGDARSRKIKVIIEYCKNREVLFILVKSKGWLICKGYGKSIAWLHIVEYASIEYSLFGLLNTLFLNKNPVNKVARQFHLFQKISGNLPVMILVKEFFYRKHR